MEAARENGTKRRRPPREEEEEVEETEERERDEKDKENGEQEDEEEKEKPAELGLEEAVAVTRGQARSRWRGAGRGTPRPVGAEARRLERRSRRAADLLARMSTDVLQADGDESDAACRMRVDRLFPALADMGARVAELAGELGAEVDPPERAGPVSPADKAAAMAAYPLADAPVRTRPVDSQFLREGGLSRPFVVDDAEGVLGMRVPGPDFDIRDATPPDTTFPVINVDETRSLSADWSFRDFSAYFFMPPAVRRELGLPVLNVLSFEFTGSALERELVRPDFVRRIDWIGTLWKGAAPGRSVPRRPKKLMGRPATSPTGILRAAAREAALRRAEAEAASLRFPRVQRYCLMSVQGCFTDFHIDFGGSSVWYHVHQGRKTFLLAPPTLANLRVYEVWDRGSRSAFIAPRLELCRRLEVRAGQTAVLPAGWIHAVHTPEHSLVFGGNFLHTRAARLQIACDRLDRRSIEDAQFRFPSFHAINWYAAEHLEARMRRLDAGEGGAGMDAAEVDGAAAVAAHLEQTLDSPGAPPPPASVADPRGLVTSLAELVGRARGARPASFRPGGAAVCAAAAASTSAAAAEAVADAASPASVPAPADPAKDTAARDAEVLATVRAYAEVEAELQRSKVWCRYCGTRASAGGWGPGPWRSANALCATHAAAYASGHILAGTTKRGLMPSEPVSRDPAVEETEVVAAVRAKMRQRRDGGGKRKKKARRG